MMHERPEGLIRLSLSEELMEEERRQLRRQGALAQSPELTGYSIGEATETQNFRAKENPFAHDFEESSLRLKFTPIRDENVLALSIYLGKGRESFFLQALPVIAIDYFHRLPFSFISPSF